MSDISDLKETYESFVKDIVQHTECVYEGEEAGNENAKMRTSALSSEKNYDSTTLTPVIKKDLESFISCSNRLFTIVEEQRNITMEHEEFFKYYTKAYGKKDGKCNGTTSFNASMWILAEDASKLQDINVAKIIRYQNSAGRRSNVKKFQNYIYMLYFQAVQFVYPTILGDKSGISEQVVKYYESIEKHIEACLEDDEDELSSDCEVNEELTDGIKEMCNSMVDELIPDDNMKGIFKNMMGNDHMNTVLGNLLNATCKPQDIKKLKEELKNTDASDWKEVCEETRKTLKGMDMDLNSFGDAEKFKSMQDNMEQRMKDLGCGDINEKMKSMFGENAPDMAQMNENMKDMMNGMDMSKIAEGLGLPKPPQETSASDNGQQEAKEPVKTETKSNADIDLDDIIQDALNKTQKTETPSTEASM